VQSVVTAMRGVKLVLTAAQRERLTSSDLTRVKEIQVLCTQRAAGSESS